MVVTFAAKRARDVPLYVASLPIFSKAYYATRPFDELTLDIPLGSGPYKVGKFEVNRYIEFERVKDWWGADLPVCRGSYNFDTVRYEFYRDRDVAFEGFTGKNYLYREEFTSRIWATRYDFPAIKDGRVKRETLPDETPSGAQGWFINTRRDKFKDPRVREALSYAFDFEWTNKTIMYGAYARTHLAVPEFRHDGDRAAVAGRAEAARAVPRPGAGRGVRRALRAAGVRRIGTGPDAVAQGAAIAAGRRATDQGWQAAVAERRGLHRSNSCSTSRRSSRITRPSSRTSARSGSRPASGWSMPCNTARGVEIFDFDMTIERFSMSATPGDSLRPYFSSQAAATKGSYNLAGIANPAIDALIEKAIAAETRADLTYRVPRA